MSVHVRRDQGSRLHGMLNDRERAPSIFPGEPERNPLTTQPDRPSLVTFDDDLRLGGTRISHRFTLLP